MIHLIKHAKIMFNETFDLVINGHVLLSGNRTGVVLLIFMQRTTKVLVKDSQRSRHHFLLLFSKLIVIKGVK